MVTSTKKRTSRFVLVKKSSVSVVLTKTLCVLESQNAFIELTVLELISRKNNSAVTWEGLLIPSGSRYQRRSALMR